MDEQMELETQKQEEEQAPEQGGKKRGRPPARTGVKVLEQRGESALVEWNDGGIVRRVYVPAQEIESDQCPKRILEAGIPHGVPWEEVVDVSQFTPQALAYELNRAGIYTRSDVETKTKAVERAILRACGVSAGTLHAAARQYEEAMSW